MRGSTRRGSGAAEVAIMLPVVLLLLMAAVEFVRMAHQGYVIDRISMEACRAGAKVLEGPYPTGDEIEETAIAFAESSMASLDVSCGIGCIIEADWQQVNGWHVLTVRVERPWDPLSGVYPTGPISLHSTYTMLTQQQVLDE